MTQKSKFKVQSSFIENKIIKVMKILYIIWNSTILFSLCLWGAASKSLVLQLFTPRFPLDTPGETVPCLFWEEFHALAKQNPSLLKTIQY